MNVLEKILKEIDKKADYYETNEQGREHIRMVDMVEVEDIIRSHMDEGNDNWIRCSERLPEEHNSMFAKFKGTDRWSDSMFAGKSDVVNVTVEFEDGTRKSDSSYTLDGIWKIEKEHRIVNAKVIAWQPLPEPHKPKKDIPAAGVEYIMGRFTKVE